MGTEVLIASVLASAYAQKKAGDRAQKKQEAAQASAEAAQAQAATDAATAAGADVLERRRKQRQSSTVLSDAATQTVGKTLLGE